MRQTTTLSPTTSIAPRRTVDLRPGLLVDVAHGGRTTTIRLVGALDLATAHRLSDLVAAGSLDDARFVTLDLSGLGHVDVTGWHALRDATRHLVEAGTRVTQVGGRATYDRLDSVLTRLDVCRRGFPHLEQGGMNASRALRRIAVTLAGALLVGAGIAMLVLPGPGLVTIALGLSVLGREHAWAAALEQRVRARLAATTRRVVPSRRATVAPVRLRPGPCVEDDCTDRAA